LYERSIQKRLVSYAGTATGQPGIGLRTTVFKHGGPNTLRLNSQIVCRYTVYSIIHVSTCTHTSKDTTA